MAVSETLAPPVPGESPVTRDLFRGFFSSMSLVLGAWYLLWRWTSSISMTEWWCSYPLIWAETLAFFSIIVSTAAFRTRRGAEVARGDSAPTPAAHMVGARVPRGARELALWKERQFAGALEALGRVAHHNIIFARGLRMPDRFAHFAAFWSCLAGVWNVVLLLAPAVFLITGCSPLIAYSPAYFLHLIPFLLANECAAMLRAWDDPAPSRLGGALVLFPIHLRAAWIVLTSGDAPAGPGPYARHGATPVRLVLPYLLMLLLTAGSITTAWLRAPFGAAMNPPGFVVNIIWALYNFAALGGIVWEAFRNAPASTDISR